MENDERRRAKREALRAKRRARQRRLRISLIAAAVVLALCAGLLFALRQGYLGGTPAALQTDPPAPPDTGGQTEPSQTQPPEPATVIHLAAAGDLNVCEQVVAAGGSEFDYRRTFMDVLPLLADADLTVMNFEGLAAGAPYGASSSAPESLLTALRDAGVDLLQTANSRSISSGIRGLNSTLQAVRAAGLEPLGTFASERDYQRSGGYTIQEVNGVRIAFVAFTKGMDGMALPEGNAHCVNLLYTDYASTYQEIDRDRIVSVLRAAASDAPDITIALLHWGSEYNDLISDSQKDVRDLMLSEGVDVIIGTHSHYVQSIEYDQDTGRFICYSLGDFFGSAEKAGSDYSIVLDLEITKDNELGVTRVTDYSYTPIYTVSDGDAYRVLRIREAMEGFELNCMDCVSQETYDSMAYALERIEARVQPPVDEED